MPITSSCERLFQWFGCSKPVASASIRSQFDNNQRLLLTNKEQRDLFLETFRATARSLDTLRATPTTENPIVSLDNLTSIDLETEKTTPLPNIYATLGMNNSPLEEIFADFVRKASRYSPKELDAMMNVESTVEKIEQAPVATLNEREVTVVKKGFFAKVVDGISATAQKVASIFKAIILAPVRLVKAIAITTAQVVKATGVFAISLASRPFRS